MIENICFDCAIKCGAKIPENHCPGMWVAKCDLCGIITGVTASRDFGRTRHLLTKENYENNIQ